MIGIHGTMVEKYQQENSTYVHLKMCRNPRIPAFHSAIQLGYDTTRQLTLWDFLLAEGTSNDALPRKSAGWKISKILFRTNSREPLSFACSQDHMLQLMQRCGLSVVRECAHPHKLQQRQESNSFRGFANRNW